MNGPHAAQSLIHRCTLLLMASLGAGTVLAGHAWGSRAQTPPAATAGASPGAGTPAASPAAEANGTPATDGTPIRVIIGETILTARLWDNVTARDLIALLPLTLTFRDFNNVEKIADLPRALAIEGMPAGDDPIPADIGYYAPSNDLVLYYGDVGYFNGIVRIGQFDGSVDAIASQTGDFTARIERTQ